ncbi:hypothetical protein ACULNC_23065 [Shigella flexneri]
MLRIWGNACGSCGDWANYDERGVVWPDAIAPFQVAIVDEHARIVPRSRACRTVANCVDKVSKCCWMTAERVPGVMFADMELMVFRTLCAGRPLSLTTTISNINIVATARNS